MVLTGTVTVGTILAMVLVFGSRVVYHGYLSSPHPVMSVLADQQVAGGVLWVLMLPAYLLTGVSLLMRWLGDEESQAKALTSGLDQLLTPGKPGKPAWPSRPGLR
jgi:cytochrome c oxidase assembly factor CtaG